MYVKSITRKSRTLFVVTIDQSGSMAGEVTIAARTLSKAEIVAEVTNDLLAELVERARRGDGVRDYYDVAIIGYSGEGVRSLLSDDRPWMPITELDAACIEECNVDRECVDENGEPRIVNHFTRRWIKAVATGLTPMYEALLMAHEIVEAWCEMEENRESFPPQIFNITDGESTDCDYVDISEIASRIKSCTTRDGAALLYNIHIASQPYRPSLIFPSPLEVDQWRDCSAAMLSLYNSASDMPQLFERAIMRLKGEKSLSRYKAMSYNASVAELITILNIGSISVKRA
ncbi:MAG: VWA domain-containing protein [Rikenellaceae bacterium]